MRTRSLIILSIIISIGLAGAVLAETRTYRQHKDVSVEESGKVMQSANKENLFECTYEIDRHKKTITRTHIRRLDDASGQPDNMVYDIKEEVSILGSPAGNGGKALIAVSRDGKEILEMGRRFAYTMRTSSFSMVITGVYKRVFASGQKHRIHN